MVEAALFILGDPEYDRMRVGYAVHMFMDWYKGDGVYGDGKDFHWDYYNSFVIQPMLADVVTVFEQDSVQYAALKPVIMERARRYATVLEKMIAPDGTYPFTGRSIVYRFGAFQLLSQAALQHFLEDSLPPQQVRSALTAVIRRTMDFPGNLDEKAGCGREYTAISRILPKATLIQAASTYALLYFCRSACCPPIPSGRRKI